MQRRVFVMSLVGLTVAACKKPAATSSIPTTTSPTTMIVHKSEGCLCCEGWVKHMQRAGFLLEVRNESNLDEVKTRVGVPAGKGSCHTAEVGGYFLEGHVPVEDVQRLLAQRPDARGLVVPGMVVGSPGMESPDGSTQPYTVELVLHSGETIEFARHGEVHQAA